MTQIQKFSLLYDGAEDRVALDTEDLDQSTTRLWLTQRLCRGVVTALVPMLAKASDAPAQHQSTIQSWEQVAAMADFGKVPAVQPTPSTVIGLVTAVHIAEVGDSYGLTFDFGDGDRRQVELARPALRQTLAVLHRLSVAAQWPTDVWPEWIADPAAAAAPADAVN